MTTRPAARLDDETLIALIEDVRATLRSRPAGVEHYEQSLAELIGEAAIRGVLGCITVQSPTPRSVEQSLIRDCIRRAATLQQLQEFADLLRQTDLKGLWVAYRCAERFRDDAERILALQHIAWHVGRRLSDDVDDVLQLETAHTEQLARAPEPVRWLEQEIVRLFDHTLSVGGDPTNSAHRIPMDDEEVA